MRHKHIDKPTGNPEQVWQFFSPSLTIQTAAVDSSFLGSDKVVVPETSTERKFASEIIKAHDKLFSNKLWNYLRAHQGIYAAKIFNSIYSGQTIHRANRFFRGSSTLIRQKVEDHMDISEVLWRIVSSGGSGIDIPKLLSMQSINKEEKFAIVRCWNYLVGLSDSDNKEDALTATIMLDLAKKEFNEPPPIGNQGQKGKSEDKNQSDNKQQPQQSDQGDNQPGDQGQQQEGSSDGEEGQDKSSEQNKQSDESTDAADENKQDKPESGQNDNDATEPENSDGSGESQQEESDTTGGSGASPQQEQKDLSVEAQTLAQEMLEIVERQAKQDEIQKRLDSANAAATANYHCKYIVQDLPKEYQTKAEIYQVLDQKPLRRVQRQRCVAGNIMPTAWRIQFGETRIFKKELFREEPKLIIIQDGSGSMCIDSKAKIAARIMATYEFAFNVYEKLIFDGDGFLYKIPAGYQTRLAAGGTPLCQAFDYLSRKLRAKQFIGVVITDGVDDEHSQEHMNALIVRLRAVKAKILSICLQREHENMDGYGSRINAGGTFTIRVPNTEQKIAEKVSESIRALRDLLC